jgi:hypothetical protein
MGHEDADDAISDLAKKVDTALDNMGGGIGRLGTRYPGEPASSFPKEVPETDEDESPRTEEEIRAHNRREARLLNPMLLPPEIQEKLRAESTPEAWERHKRRALDNM